MEALLETKIFKVSVERLLLNGGQTLYMVGIALLIGTVLGTLLALVLVLCRKGGLVENKVLHSIVSLYINVVRSVPFIILLVTIIIHHKLPHGHPLQNTKKSPARQAVTMARPCRGFLDFILGNTAQFPPYGLSTAPAAAARHLRCQNAR